VLLGPPGVGKGTQGRRIASEKRWPLISTGEILREAVARRTPLGQQAQRVMDSGQLVGDDLMNELVRERLAEPDAEKGFVLDGYPRTVVQAEALDAMLAERSLGVDAALAFDAPAEELVRRLGARRECPVCQRAYNMMSAPPRENERCDDHPGSTLVRRADDGEETIRKRLLVYEAQTLPLVGYYRAKGRLLEVPGTGSMDQVFERMRQTLAVAVGGR